MKRRSRNDGTRLTRTERAALARRNRAQAHLANLRGLNPTRASSTGALVLLVALSVAAGALPGVPLITAVRGWVAPEPPRLASIHVRGASQLALVEIAVATGLPGGVAVADIDPRAVAKRLEGHAWIAEARAVMLPLGDLVVEVVERRALAVIAEGVDGPVRAVDAAGIPFAPATPVHRESLPRLVTDGEITVDEPNASLAEAVALAYRLPAFGLHLPAEVGVSAEPEGFSVQLAERPTRVLLGREDLDSKLEGLAHILAANAVPADEPASLDLRFAGQGVLRASAVQTGPAQAAAARGNAAASMTRPSG